MSAALTPQAKSWNHSILYDQPTANFLFQHPEVFLRLLIIKGTGAFSSFQEVGKGHLKK